MKKNLLLLLLIATQLHSSGQSNFAGTWEGKVTAGVELRVIFTIRQDESHKYTATMDVPDQGIKGIVAGDVVVSNDSIVISIKEFGGSYAGKQIDSTTINGEWRQGISTPLQLKKIEKVQMIQRPQTPLPPFPYKSEDILYSNKDSTIQFGATITIPNGSGPFPAVLLITGSGQQNRDEEIAAHRPFAVIADHLTRNGFIVLRVDDRNMGQTTGDARNATTLDFSDDASTSIDYLKTRKEVDIKRIALLGHSEGGMIAEMLASRRKDIAAIVLLGAPGNSGANILVEQNRMIYRSSGMPEEFVNRYIELYAALITHAKKENSKETIKANVTTEVNNWTEKTPKNIVIATTGILNEQSKQVFIDNFTEVLSLPWIQYFLASSPLPTLKRSPALYLH